jgi:hypothetical protein
MGRCWKRSSVTSFTVKIFAAFFFIGNSGAREQTANKLGSAHQNDHYSLGSAGEVWNYRIGEIQVVEVLLARGCRMNIREVKKLGLPKDIYRSAGSDNAVLVVTGGFFGYDAKGSYVPIGLVRSNGKRVSRFMPWSSGGILVGDEKSISILTVREISKSEKWPQAIQSKPILISNNAVDVRPNLRDAEFNRVAIGLTSRKQIYIVGVFHDFGEAVTLLDHAEIFIKLAKQRNLTINSALAMDGGPGAHIFVPVKDRIYGDSAPTFIPNVVSFTDCK